MEKISVEKNDKYEVCKRTAFSQQNVPNTPPSTPNPNSLHSADDNYNVMTMTVTMKNIARIAKAASNK